MEMGATEQATPAASTVVDCTQCNDTRKMPPTHTGYLCTFCPRPCEQCRGRPDAYCNRTPCPCACHAVGGPNPKHHARRAAPQPVALPPCAQPPVDPRAVQLGKATGVFSAAQRVANLRGQHVREAGLGGLADALEHLAGALVAAEKATSPTEAKFTSDYVVQLEQRLELSRAERSRALKERDQLSDELAVAKVSLETDKMAVEFWSLYVTDLRALLKVREMETLSGAIGDLLADRDRAWKRVKLLETRADQAALHLEGRRDQRPQG